MRRPPGIVVIGGGLAGMAAALRLAEQGLRVDLYEARQALGGRAASYRDPATGELIDHCQHVAMACCTNFHDFCQRAGIGDQFERLDTLHFFAQNGQRYDLRAAQWLPAPLHLAPSLLGLGYLTIGERLGIGRALVQLARTKPTCDESIGHWLRRHGQSKQAIQRFWSVVLVSALGENVDRAALAPARKVFVDGFINNRAGYQVDVPRRSLRELFDQRVADELIRLGVTIHRNCSVESLLGDARRITAVRFAACEPLFAEAVVLAIPWRRLAAIVPPDLHAALPQVQQAQQISAAPITGVHLWFDRPLTPLTHAVLVDRLSQWVFRREVGAHHYYQVVISASRDLSQVPAEDVVRQVVIDLSAIFPAAREATLIRSKVVTEREAVFSYRVGFDELRPAPATGISNLFIAGDWAQTGWPSTLESAVRSGYLAAERLLAERGRNCRLIAADLPRSWLARRLWRR